MPEPMGFYTDTTVCIGCKACEVACKEWNQLPSTNGGVNTLSGDSYDNTRQLDGIHWRHVKLIRESGDLQLELACESLPAANGEHGDVERIETG